MVTDDTPEAIFPPAIDATMRSSWNTCPHLFFRRHCQGLTTLDAISIDLHFGACFARGLEVVRHAYWGGKPQSVAVCDGSEAVVEAWGAYEFTPKTKNQEKKTLDACLLALSDYFVIWNLDNDLVRIHEERGEPCIEFAGAAPIPGTAHPTNRDPETGEPEAVGYAGRFDVIVDYQATTMGLDDKTGQVSRDSSKWSLRGQFTGYTWLAQEYGFPLSGFIVREVEPLINTTKLNQVITPRPKWMLDSWLRQLQVDIDDMVRAWREWQHQEAYGFGRHQHAHPFRQVFDDGCYSWNRPCEFQPLCTAEHPERWLDSYHVSRWNPIERTTR